MNRGKLLDKSTSESGGSGNHALNLDTVSSLMRPQQVVDANRQFAHRMSQFLIRTGNAEMPQRNNNARSV
jgi:hypothetical protein